MSWENGGDTDTSMIPYDLTKSMVVSYGIPYQVPSWFSFQIGELRGGEG